MMICVNSTDAIKVLVRAEEAEGVSPAEDLMSRLRRDSPG